MALGTSDLENYILRRGSRLFHVSPAPAREDVLTGGLVPGSERGSPVRDDFFRPRPGRVYLCRLDDVCIVDLGDPMLERTIFSVDLAQLDPERFDPDEDLVMESFDGGRPGWVPVEPPTRTMGPDGRAEVPGQAGALAAWADSVDGFDAPRITLASLNAGRVAYRGTIPADALDVFEMPALSAAALRSGLIQRWGAVAEALPQPPPVGFYRIEADRALAVAESTAEEVRVALVPTAPKLLDRVRHPEHLARLADDLRAAEREALDAVARTQGLSPLPALDRAIELLEATSRLAPEEGWMATRDVCVCAGLQAASALDALGEVVGRALARDAAVRVLGVAAAAPRRN